MENATFLKHAFGEGDMLLKCYPKGNEDVTQSYSRSGIIKTSCKFTQYLGKCNIIIL